MSEGHSKFIIAIETLLLLVPTSSIALLQWGFTLVNVVGRPLGRPTLDFFVFIQLPMISLVCGWTLVIRFFVYGSDALRSTSGWIWSGAIIGGIVAIAALIEVVAIHFGDVSIRAALPEYFGLLVIGSPALVPLIHIVLERIFRKSVEVITG
jgi:hypothetical protein